MSNSSSDHQSESMGRSSDDEIDEEIVPMKAPATNKDATNKADSSFLDEDFLSFGHVDNGGEETSNDSNINKKNMAGRKRERPHEKHTSAATTKASSSATATTTPSIPWLDNNNDDTNNSQSQYPTQQSQHGRNNHRGYNNNHHSNNYHHNYYTPPTPPFIKLHNEIVSFMKLMSPTPQELEIREQMVRRITTLATHVFHKEGIDCEVLPFGSQVTGLSLPGSDIDFVIRFPNKKEKNGKKNDSETGEEEEEEEEEDWMTTFDPLQKIADAVKTEFGVKTELETDVDDDAANSPNNDNNPKDKEHLSYLEVITQTRVPLVKFTIAPYNLDIDICFNQPHGPESADLMHRFMESMPPLRPLTFCLKYFLASREINKPFTGGIGSYLLQLMIVSFLQHRSRYDLNRGYGGSGQHYNLGSLLLDFLELYGVDYNYVTTGISVRHDGYYFPKGQLDKREYFWQPTRPTSIAVENPLDPTMDVGAGAYRIQMISRVFEHAFKTLLAYVSEPMEMTDSILARILPVTEEMVQRRMLMDEMEDKKKKNGGGGGGGEGVAKAKAASVGKVNGGGDRGGSKPSPPSDKQRGMTKRNSSNNDKRNNSSKNWDKNKDNKKRRHSSSSGDYGGGGSGSEYSGGKFQKQNKKKRYSK
jgi:non-canonical poly(A) RNA polymerase PAPD5/7